ncbi:UDP-glucuronosyl/UDP-glucosyltransferase [Cinara cedri]|uniref:UDP-glucuronosyltransferase n=1 Tax=Cinara cedri TaxID=506608 RepID=A0A5E4MJJ6_9HEMI|nr:UDP-glucuronosyl/UDP-glucosyltransferase [Cinara cedri]
MASPSRNTARKVRLLAAIVVLGFAGPGRPAECARVLAVETMGSKSHWNFMSGVIRALLDKGHGVTAFTPFADGVVGENYTRVDVSGEMETALAVDVYKLKQKWSSPFGKIDLFLKMSRDFCDMIYENGEMQTALGSSDFDAVLVEPFMSHCVSYTAHRLKLPIIYITPVPTIEMLKRDFTGHFPNPAIESNVFAGHAVPETFVQRFTNAMTIAYVLVAKEYSEWRLTRAEPKHYDRVPRVQPSLFFVNGHFVSTSPTATSANVVNIGGIHLNTPVRDLTEDISEFIEQSPDGVIYFTFGSTVKMSSLPKHVEKAFLETFAQIPERVIWKYEDVLTDKPKNVMTKKWLPQRDILSHPKVKLFISHGGISGLYEAIDAGVPILGFPLFGDQPKNIAHLVNSGMAISMDLFSVTTGTLLKNVLELLRNETYAQNAKKNSEIFKDRPLSASESVVYWTEYVIRHKGAAHLKSQALNLTWYQYYLLDVIATAFAFAFIVCFVIYKILKSTCTFALNYYCSRIVKSKSE